jgi:hypothetical protein
MTNVVKTNKGIETNYRVGAPERGSASAVEVSAEVIEAHGGWLWATRIMPGRNIQLRLHVGSKEDGPVDGINGPLTTTPNRLPVLLSNATLLDAFRQGLRERVSPIFPRDLSGKRLQVLKEIVPRLSHAAVFSNAMSPGNAQALKHTADTAGALGLKLQYREIHGGRLWAAPNDGAGATFQFTLDVGIEEKRPLIV